MKARNANTLAALGLALSLSVSPLAVAAVQPLDRVVAVVNDEAIMSSDLDQRVGQVRQQMQSRDIGMPDQSELRGQVLSRMITEQIELQMAERANLSVSDSDLNQAMRGVAQRNNMTLEQFADRVEQEGMSYGQVREQIRRELLITQVQQRSVASQVNISDREVDQYLKQAGSNANVQYHLAHILIAVPQAPTPQQAEAARDKAEQLRQAITSGQAGFQEVAAAQSDGPQALDGGDLGWRSGAEMPSIFDDVVPNLNVGEVSEPVRSPSGYHLITLLDKRGGGNAEQQREQIRRTLFQRKVNEELEAWTQEIRASAYVDNRLEQGGGTAP
ncbi:peptidylprolyl isomerase [Kushneria indalinina]|uniref:Peptidyl-prolyl cis-trans isomerase SurA n=1 Tax=Kushneria indalinina DSM 14324 TaxID=1122140 RepID=A0A3D9DYD1_9GAMM|nr:peptidylprolyl isomerase [Kushneria indalinina]REC95711.1 peptidyl-prolyl cis-trans isomerase SurA [Kushneria indalinina DSM 14324]